MNNDYENDMKMIGRTLMVYPQDAKRPIDRLVKYTPVKHGQECEKVTHLGKGYLHASDDEGPYDVDGCVYCGRCHLYLGKVI